MEAGLVERHPQSVKLVHGGIRYLEQLDSDSPS
jgi:hypothetical protein